ncbi:MAG: hypothetical protein ACREXT_18070, partial [Gammaproteobacteria bacterium]
GTYLLSSVKNMARMWFSANLPDRLPIMVKGLLVAVGITVLIFGVTGIVLVLRRDDSSRKLFVFAALGMFSYFTLTLCWLHTEARYTLPARLLLLVFASHAIARVAHLVKSRNG